MAGLFGIMPTDANTEWKEDLTEVGRVLVLTVARIIALGVAIGCHRLLDYVASKPPEGFEKFGLVLRGFFWICFSLVYIDLSVELARGFMFGLRKWLRERVKRQREAETQVRDLESNKQ